MSGKDDANGSRAGTQLSPDLVFKLQAGAEIAPLEAADLDALRACLAADPHAVAIILQALEFKGEELEDPTSHHLVKVLIEQRVGIEPLRYLLRFAGCQSEWDGGTSSKFALEFLECLDGNSRLADWMDSRSIGMRSARIDGHQDFMGKELKYDSMHRVRARVQTDSTLLPLLFADGALGRFRDDFIVLLAGFTSEQLADFELGGLQARLDEVWRLVGGVSNPRERMKAAAIGLGHSWSWLFDEELNGSGVPHDLLPPAGSSDSLEVLLEVAAKGGYQASHLDLLARHYSQEPEVIELLLRIAEAKLPCRFPSRAERLLEIIAPQDSRVRDRMFSPERVWPLGFQDERMGFDAIGYAKWCETSEERRKMRIEGVLNGSDVSLRENCVHSLIYWFSEHPETFRILADYVCEPAEGENSQEEKVRKTCLELLGYRWGNDERVFELAKKSLGHPWVMVRREAARILTRDYPDNPATEAVLLKRIGEDEQIFGEYLSLKAGDPGSMTTALKVLEENMEMLASQGPRYLLRTCGPRKDLGAAFRELASRPDLKPLSYSINEMLETYWS